MNARSFPDYPRTSVVILTCGQIETTLACLRSVADSAYPDLQLVVVNNGAGEAMTEALRVFGKQCDRNRRAVVIETNPDNVGACRGRNQALARVDGQFVAFLDNDIICHDPHGLTRMVTLLRSDPSTGMVGPRIVPIADPDVLECAGYAVDLCGGVHALGVGQSVNLSTFKVCQKVQAVGNFVAPTDLIRAVGGFDEDFDPFGFENIDCCYRVKAAGRSVVCDGRTDVRHVGHVTTGTFQEKGRSVLFNKSLLLRRKWGGVFERETSLYAALTSLGGPANRDEVNV